MASDEEYPYEETVSRTKSEPLDKTTVSEKTTVVSSPEARVENREVKSVSTNDDESVSAKAREAGRTLKELAYSLGKKTKQVTEEKAQELKAQSLDINTTRDARDIQYLGDHIQKLLAVFEDTMTEIRAEPYDEQDKLLLGYRKLLEEQINVIDARRDLARRLKPGA